jgi:hypothetical protein
MVPCVCFPSLQFILFAIRSLVDCNSLYNVANVFCRGVAGCALQHGDAGLHGSVPYTTVGQRSYTRIWKVFRLEGIVMIQAVRQG